MLGAIIGDIVGSRFEFNPTNNYYFDLFGEGCAFTDDTICTVAVADAILRGRDYGESIHEWCRRYPNPKGGYGGRFRAWVMSDNPRPYGSFGNGSAMRVSPIAWWFDLQTGLYEEAERSAACTHNHRFGVEGARAVVAAITNCRRLRKMKRGKPITREDILNRGLSRSISEYRWDTWNFDVRVEDHRNRFDETCQGTVPVALAIILESTGFEDAIRKAVSLGADADTLGAIVGSIAEALWGIPEWMKVKALTYLPAEMREVIRKFHILLNNRRILSARCRYYLVGDTRMVDERHLPAFAIERDWVEMIAGDDTVRLDIKRYMRDVMPMGRWRYLSEKFGLPLTLLGMIYRRTMHNWDQFVTPQNYFMQFLERHYQTIQVSQEI